MYQSKRSLWLMSLWHNFDNFQACAMLNSSLCRKIATRKWRYTVIHTYDVIITLWQLTNGRPHSPPSVKFRVPSTHETSEYKLLCSSKDSHACRCLCMIKEVDRRHRGGSVRGKRCNQGANNSYYRIWAVLPPSVGWEMGVWFGTTQSNDGGTYLFNESLEDER